MDQLSLDGARRLLESGQFGEAKWVCKSLLAGDPLRPDVHNLLGVVYCNLGEFSNAVPHLRQALRTNPFDLECLCYLGTAYRHVDLRCAAEVFEYILKLDSSYVNAEMGLGIVRFQERRFVESQQILESALEKAPGSADLWNNLGLVMFELDRHADAVECYMKSMNLGLAKQVGMTNMGNSLVRCGQPEAARACFQDARDNGNTTVAIECGLGTVERNLGNYPAAIDHFKRAIDISSCDAAAHWNLATTLEKAEESREAIEHYEVACRMKPTPNVRRLRGLTLCPTVFSNRAEISEFRRRLLETIEQFTLCARSLCTSALEKWGVPPPFNLVFHGDDDLPIKRTFAHLYSGVESTVRVKKLPAKRRIVFVVTLPHDLAFARCMKNVVAELCVTNDIVIACSSLCSDRLRRSLNQIGCRIVPLSDRLEIAVEQIQELRAKVLYYWEIGTDTLNYFLPFFRLAPVQCSSWGFPVTSGIPNVDYFITSQLLEPIDAADKYSESLIQLDSLPMFERHPLKLEPHCRRELGFGKEDHIYLCAQHPNKIQPDFDDLISALINKDPLARVCFIEDERGYAAQHLRARLEQKIQLAAHQIIWLRRMDQKSYERLVSIADVVLDTTNYGGVMSTLDAIGLGKPVVTLPGAYQRGRFALACHRLLGTEQLVAHNSGEYVEIATRLCKEADFREDTKSRIENKKHRIFGDRTVIEQYDRIFDELLSC